MGNTRGYNTSAERLTLHRLVRLILLQSINQSINRSIDRSINQSIYLTWSVRLARKLVYWYATKDKYGALLKL